MKYEVTSNESGQLSIKSAAAFVPPLGLVIPAKQTVRAVVPSSRTFATLFSSSSPNLPTGFQVQPYNGDVYVFDSGDWINEATSENANSTEVSGTIYLTNYGLYDIGMSW